MADATCLRQLQRIDRRLRLRACREAKDALAELFRAVRRNQRATGLARRSLRSQAFSAERLQSYRDALSATAVAGAVVRRRSRAARGGVAAIGRRRGLRRRDARPRSSRASKKSRSSRTISSRSSRSTPRRRGSTRSLSSRSSRFRGRRSTRNTPPNSPRCKRQRGARRAIARAAQQRIDDMIIEASVRRDDQMTACRARRCRSRSATINRSPIRSRRPSIRSCADCCPARRTGRPPSRACSTTC